MPSPTMNLLAAGLLALGAAPAHAFFDGMIAGMTSVSNNLIDSTENVTITTVNTTSTTILLLSNDIGKMADRINVMADKIGVMADRIGVMADRIVLTESMMAGIAHKVLDNGQVRATRAGADRMEVHREADGARRYAADSRVRQGAYPAVPAGNPYLLRGALPAASAGRCGEPRAVPPGGLVC